MIRKFLLVIALISSLLSMPLMATEHQSVNINTADQSQLESIKGIGTKRAKTILDERQKNGPFKDAEDLKNRVKGIGDKSIKKLQENGLTIGKADTSSSNSNSQKNKKSKNNNDENNNSQPSK